MPIDSAIVKNNIMDALIIRCQTSQGMLDLTFSSTNATFGDLQSAIMIKYGIASNAQIISKTPPNTPQFIENVSPQTKLSDIGLNDGDIIYLIMSESQINFFKQKQEIERPTQPTLDVTLSANDNSDYILALNLR